MSWWAWMTIHTGLQEHEVEEIGNMTWNVGRILQKGLGCPLRDLDGRRGEDILTQVEGAVAVLKDPRRVEELRALEPDNGWGSLEGATEFLEGVLDACREHPAATLRVS